MDRGAAMGYQKFAILVVQDEPLPAVVFPGGLSGVRA
jgi:hypothetical protein